MMHDFPDEITPQQPGTIMEETRRLTSLVNDVLDISKLESDMEQLNREEFSLTESVADAIARMNELLSGDNFHIEFTHDSDVIVKSDEAKINRAFYNLLINAINYSGDSREVLVAQTVTGGFVRISITDYGEGIAEDELPFIWDRYYKSGKKHRRAVTGTGLGLSIVKKIVELHGGRYGVSSKAQKGSTFWFEIEGYESAGS
jgi:signal transduction histidine kinase